MGQNVLDTNSFGGTNGNALSTYNANWYFGTNNYGIGRLDSRVFHSLATSSTARAANDVVNFQVVGTVLTLVVNQNTLLTYDTASDGTKYTTGNPGIRLFHSVSGVRLGGSWRAGSVTSGGPTPDQLVPAYTQTGGSWYYQDA